MPGAFPPRHRRAIATWLKRRGYAFSYGRHIARDEIDFDERRVSIACQAQPVVGALHECGHVLLHLARRRRPHARIAGATLEEFNANGCYSGRRGSLLEGLHVVREEISAWDRGLKLGRRLRLGLAPATYHRHALKNTLTYVRWLACR